MNRQAARQTWGQPPANAPTSSLRREFVAPPRTAAAQQPSGYIQSARQTWVHQPANAPTSSLRREFVASPRTAAAQQPGGYIQGLKQKRSGAPLQQPQVTWNREVEEREQWKKDSVASLKAEYGDLQKIIMNPRNSPHSRDIAMERMIAINAEIDGEPGPFQVEVEKNETYNPNQAPTQQMFTATSVQTITKMEPHQRVEKWVMESEGEKVPEVGKTFYGNLRMHPSWFGHRYLNRGPRNS